MYIVIAAGVVYLAVSIALGILISYMFSFRRGFRIEDTFNIIVEGGEAPADFLTRNTFTEFTVPSDYGYDITGVYRAGSCDKTIVFAHGHTFTWHGGIKYMHTFIEKGWNIVAFNHRHHGTSGGKNCTAGYYEKYDLKRVADFAFQAFPETKMFGVHGESLGGAVTLQYSPLDSRLSFVVVDSAFANARDLFLLMLRRSHIPYIVAYPARVVANVCMRLFSGFSLKNVSPQDDILKTRIPMLFFHGRSDDYVPYAMSQKMYNQRKNFARTELVLIEGARHSRSYMTNPVFYNKTIWEFIDSIAT